MHCIYLCYLTKNNFFVSANVSTIGAVDLGQIPVMLDENFTLFMKNLLIFAS